MEFATPSAARFRPEPAGQLAHPPRASSPEARSEAASGRRSTVRF